MMAVTGEGAWIVQTPRLPMKANGSGDVTAALFTAHLHTTGSPAEALAATVSSVFDLLQATLDSGERELRLIAAAGRLRAPADAVRGVAGPLSGARPGPAASARSRSTKVAGDRSRDPAG